MGDNMLHLQNQLYNQIVTGAGLTNNYFQLILPGSYVSDDLGLWNIQNLIPPFSLTWNNLAYQAVSFFNQYASLIGQLTFPQSKFEKDIGTDNYKKWMEYLKGINPPPPPNEQPVIFQKWAMFHCPDKMSVGIADLSAMVNIEGAKAQIRPYLGQNPKHVDFSDTFSELQTALNESGTITVSLDSKTSDKNVDNAWTNGTDQCYFGLWTDSSKDSILNKKFGNSHISSQITFNKWTLLKFSPGEWYNSGVLHQAYVAKNGQIPWPSNPNPDWQKLFGEQGSMRQVSFSVFVVDKIMFSMKSDADFSSDEQERIIQNIFNGLWPFYDSNMDNQVVFNEGGMSVHGETTSNSPVVIGCNVMQINKYLTST